MLVLSSRFPLTSIAFVFWSHPTSIRYHQMFWYFQEIKNMQSLKVTLQISTNKRHLLWTQLSCGCVSGCLNKWWRNAWRSTRIISSLASPFINRGLIYQNSSPTTHQYVRLWGPSWARYPSAIQSGLLGQQLELTGLAWPSGIIWVSEIILPLQRRKYNRGHNWKCDKASRKHTKKTIFMAQEMVVPGWLYSFWNFAFGAVMDRSFGVPLGIVCVRSVLRKSNKNRCFSMCTISILLQI